MSIQDGVRALVRESMSQVATARANLITARLEIESLRERLSHVPPLPLAPDPQPSAGVAKGGVWTVDAAEGGRTAVQFRIFGFSIGLIFNPEQLESLFAAIHEHRTSNENR